MIYGRKDFKTYASTVISQKKKSKKFKRRKTIYYNRSKTKFIPEQELIRQQLNKLPERRGTLRISKSITIKDSSTMITPHSATISKNHGMLDTSTIVSSKLATVNMLQNFRKALLLKVQEML